MRLIDRLQRYLESKKITAYAFEKTCGVANGYLGKQIRGKGSVGSDILEKISVQYPDLNLIWLITGKGKMIIIPSRDRSEDGSMELKEDDVVYAARTKLITVLREQLNQLESNPGTSTKANRKKKGTK